MTKVVTAVRERADGREKESRRGGRGVEREGDGEGVGAQLDSPI